MATATQVTLIICITIIILYLLEKKGGNVDKIKVEEFNKLINNISDLIRQIEISDFKDENGHRLKKNEAYCSLVKSIEKLIKTK